MKHAICLETKRSLREPFWLVKKDVVRRKMQFLEFRLNLMFAFDRILDENSTYIYEYVK